MIKKQPARPRYADIAGKPLFDGFKQNGKMVYNMQSVAILTGCNWLSSGLLGDTFKHIYLLYHAEQQQAAYYNKHKLTRGVN